MQPISATTASDPPGILSVGSVNADFQARVDRPAGEVETQAARCLARQGGGKAANVAVLARRLGHPAWLLGAVGDDDLAEQALRPVREAGVDVAGVRRIPGCGTAVSMIAVPPGGKKSIVLAGEANLRLDAQDARAFAACIGRADPRSVLVADYEAAPGPCSRAIEAARDRGLRVALDPSFPDAVDRAVLPAVEALLPNEEEALALAGAGGAGPGALAGAARALRAMGPRMVVLKLGDGGCLLALPDGTLQAFHPLAGLPDPVDATGAGDAFTGAFAVAMLENAAPADAARFAIACTELAVQAFGSQPAYPHRAAADAQLRRGPRGPRPAAGADA
ncbi:MAG: PfkB family carbohydrate kinase [Xylophilus ampelinus]